MGKRVILAVMAAGLLLPGLPSRADPNCQCRANGKVFDQGELACIRTNSGQKLARCEMLLNNSSWTILRDGCPSASLPAGPASSNAAAAATVASAWPTGTDHAELACPSPVRG